MVQAFLPVLGFMADAAAPSYAGVEACRRCHPAQYREQSASPHARALAHSTASQPGDWAFGAAVQAITFVKRLDADYYLEESQSWYRAINSYARTPGHENDAGIRDRIFDPSAAILRCFACHSTGPVQVSRDHVITPSEAGVRCEVCHGPAAAHARQPARFHPSNPARFTAAELNRFCGQCHRAPLETADTPDLRDPWNARYQPLMLDASRCFRQSEGRLSCLTCHDPHAPAARKLAAYDKACVGCHAQPKHKAATSGRACAECHMPAVEAQPHLSFANHRIAIYSPTDSMSPLSEAR